MGVVVLEVESEAKRGKGKTATYPPATWSTRLSRQGRSFHVHCPPSILGESLDTGLLFIFRGKKENGGQSR